MRLSRCEVRDHINYRKNDRWRSHRFYRALQRLKPPMRYICGIFQAPRFSSFSTQSVQSGRALVYPRTHRAVSKLGIQNHSTAQKRLTTSLTSLASENRLFVKSHFRLQEQERFHSRTFPKDRPLVYCPCRLSESFQSGRPGDCAIYVCRR